MSERATGTVKWFNNKKGYGFIEQDSGEDVFVHYRNISADGFRTLRLGQLVEFNLKSGPKGLLAEEVRVVAETAEIDE